jgi:hypothetical protein
MYRNKAKKPVDKTPPFDDNLFNDGPDERARLNELANIICRPIKLNEKLPTIIYTPNTSCQNPINGYQYWSDLPLHSYNSPI